MTLGVVSDTHGNRDLMLGTARLMRDVLGVEIFYHLGDDYGDGQELVRHGYAVRAVPGLWCREYHDGQVANRLLDEVDGLLVAAAHAEKDLLAAHRAASIVLTGHTHEASLELIGASLYVNPGHLKGTAHRGERASFATLALAPDTVHAAIHEVDGTVRRQTDVPRARLA